MRDYTKFYIDGQWVEPAVANPLDVINPATEEVAGKINLGSAADVDRAVAAAKAAFTSFSRTSVKERIELMGAIAGGALIPPIAGLPAAPRWAVDAAATL